MPKKTEAATTASADLTYIGPPGQDSPVFGLLIAGQRYQADAAFAAYLVARHPEYWQPAAAAKKE